MVIPAEKTLEEETLGPPCAVTFVTATRISVGGYLGKESRANCRLYTAPWTNPGPSWCRHPRGDEQSQMPRKKISLRNTTSAPGFTYLRRRSFNPP